MPLYDYKCRNCGKTVEIRHGFNDAHTQPCAECGGELTRVFNAAPIVFKGSGFYVTDSRKSGAAENAPAAKSDAPKTGAPKSDAAKSDAPKAEPAKSTDAAPAAKSGGSAA